MDGRILFVHIFAKPNEEERMKLFTVVCAFFLLGAGFNNVAASQTVKVYNPAGITADGKYIDYQKKKLMHQKGMKKPPLVGDFPDVKVEEVEIERDAYAELNDLFYKRGWTDGLPIVPPTPERVKEMLTGTDLGPDFLVTSLDPMAGQATVEKIAVNAVMAGCRPEYMPLLLTAVDAAMDPNFNLRGLATTTNPDAIMVIVSGPVAEDLDINSGTNALGRGWRANATIGRALNLIIQNVGGSWPGLTDMSCLGTPGDFSMCLAENEKKSPWPPFRIDFGFPKRTSVVTLVGAEGTQAVLGVNQSSEGFMKMVAENMAGMDRPARGMFVLIVAQDTAKMLAAEGWTRGKIKKYIQDNAHMPFDRYKEKYIDTGTIKYFGRNLPSWILETKDPKVLIPTPVFDDMLIMVAGGPGEKSMIIPAWSCIISKEIRLPGFWRHLVEK